MRAIRIENWCTPDALRVVEIQTLQCGPKQLRIRVHAVPVTYSLWLLIQGKYQRKPALPFVPGSFIAGEVIECGEGTSRFKPGDRVVAALDTGGLAEEAIALELNTYAIPETLSFERANAFNTAYSSALAALSWSHVLALTAGQKLLVLGAAGGVGIAAVEIGRILGATVIAAASTEQKRSCAIRHGAHHVVESDLTLLHKQVMSATNGEGVDAVLDPVGGGLFREALRCIRPEGRIATVGFASGDVPQIPANLLLVKNVAVCGFNMSHYKITQGARYEARVRALFTQLGLWFEEGLINPVTAASFTLERTPDAFATVLDREHFGHVVVIPIVSPVVDASRTDSVEIKSAISESL